MYIYVCYKCFVCVANILTIKNKMIKSNIKGVNTIYAKMIRRPRGKKKKGEGKKGAGWKSRKIKYINKNTST